MQKIKIGIVGYGNLGKAVEKCCYENDKVELIAIFSHRIVVSKLGTKIISIKSINRYKDKIDILVMCGGSFNDILNIAPKLLHNFNIINSFDDHSKIEDAVKQCDVIAKKSNTYGLFSFGWDPGIFSLIRALFFGISNQPSFTFWGKGVSMGHTNALKAIDGVKHAIAYTIPIKHAVRQAHKNNDTLITHERRCYVVKNAKKREITKKIKLNKDYFANCKLKIKFINEKQFIKKHSSLFHEGQIINNFNIYDQLFSMNFNVKMSSNPLFTAKILLMFASVILHIKNSLPSGAYTIFDLPISTILRDCNIVKKFC